MKKLILIALISFSASAISRTEKDIERDISKAIDESITLYQESGISGLSINSQECYENVSNKGFYCVYLDLAAMHIDELFTSNTGLPPSEYFSGKNPSFRMWQVFSMSNMTIDQGKEYLDAIGPIVDKKVDEKFMSSIRP